MSVRKRGRDPDGAYLALASNKFEKLFNPLKWYWNGIRTAAYIQGGGDVFKEGETLSGGDRDYNHVLLFMLRNFDLQMEEDTIRFKKVLVYDLLKNLICLVAWASTFFKNSEILFAAANLMLICHSEYNHATVCI